MNQNGNGFAADGMDPPTNATEVKASDYMSDETPMTAATDTSAYVEPEENIVSIVSVGLGAISVRSRPPKDDWFRAHPDGAMSTGMTLLKGKMGDLFAVRRELIPIAGPEVSKALVKASVTACVTIDGAKFLWDILHPVGNANQQHFDNALAARDLSRSTWIRFFWDANQETHLTVTPKQTTSAEAKWPESFTLGDWIDKAFKGKFIDSLDHKIIRKIRGEL
jgi:hypothetical protein